MVGGLAVTVMVVVAGSGMTMGQKSTTTTVAPYWWLGMDPSPFGGRNYNIEEAGGRHFQTWLSSLA